MGNQTVDRRCLLLAGTGFLLGCTALEGRNANWPARPITIVVPYPAGGAADTTGRILASALEDQLKTSVVVENRPGANGSIGAAVVAKASPDGYTLLLDATGFAVNPSLLPQLPYDTATAFAPVSLLMQVPLLLVVPPSSPYATVADLVRDAKARPGKLSFGSAGSGSATHLGGELFKQGHKISITHIPYRGGAPALGSLAAGQIEMMFSAITASYPLVQGGKLRALAVTSPERVALVPQLPTVAEAGLPGFSAQEWNGLWAPAGTPQSVLARLQVEVAAAMKRPEVKDRLAANGARAIGSTRAELATFVDGETRKWANLIKSARITID